MAFRILSTQFNLLTACALIMGLLAGPMELALAGSDFGANWKATPLVDTSITPPVVAAPKIQSVKPAPPAQPELEARLKPAEPFIKDVEAKLLMTPTTGSPLVQRLDNLQMVLFGEQKYQDAGQLLAKLAEIFPQEAAKANAELNKQLQSNLPPVKQVPTANTKTAAKQTIQAPYTGNGSMYSSQYPPQTASRPTKQPKAKKKGFWADDWDDDFKNDPFFQDQPQQQQANPGGPSKLAAVGQGLTSLALIAGSLAGTYYLNKHSGNNYYPNNGYYNGGYYNTPYGYGAYPYGTVPYGTPVTGGYPGYYGYPQTYYMPRSYTYTPYSSSTFGSTFGSSTPLGVPTGIRPF